jgi:hypothetical protein
MTLTPTLWKSRTQFSTTDKSVFGESRRRPTKGVGLPDEAFLDHGLSTKANVFVT